LQRSPEQQTALDQLMLDLQSKDSPNFHKWLAPQEFGLRFGPADADIQTVMSWLASQGFHDIKVGSGRVVIEFSGNVGQVRNAFHTEIHHFFVNNEMRQANVSDPEIPAALTPVVRGTSSSRSGRPTSPRSTTSLPQASTVLGLKSPSSVSRISTRKT
jgi:subtilase family serine protease